MLIEEIVDSFGLPNSPKHNPVPRERVVQWMASDDLEAIGAVYAFLSKTTNLNRVSPVLSLQDLNNFSMYYFERCMVLNQEGEWAHGRYAAAWDIASWFASLWGHGTHDRTMQRRFKDWLAQLYKNSDAETQRCIVDGALEHMFEDASVRSFFADWKDDPTLAIAYAEALNWVKKKH